MDYTRLAIFASPRSGSNLLCEQLSDGLHRLYRQRSVVNFYEILSPHAHVSDNGKCIQVDIHDSLPRPPHMPIDIYRLNRLRRMDGIAVFKIFPRDITAHNIGLIEELVFDAECSYRICLNRIDTGNQLMSYFISKATGVWHANQRKVTAAVSMIHVSREDMASLAGEIKMHYLWHAENRDRCHRVVWTDQLQTATYPDLLGHSDMLYQSQSRLNDDHRSKVRECVANASELIDHADALDDELSDMKRYLR